MAKEDLENLFVQRHDLAARIIEQIQNSVTTRSKHYNLIVGPRGIGKTHLISLLYHRVTALTNLRTRMAVAWLREEEWGVTTFLDFCLRALRSLEDGGEIKIPAGRMDALYELKPAQAEKAATSLLVELLGDRVLVLLVENLDDLFTGLADAGQKTFRSFLQENGRCTVVATSPGLFEAVTRRQSPFFGFFRIEHLQTLTLQETCDLFEKIARRKGDDQLADFILTNTGRARIRAIHYLGDGNPRVFAILSDFLTKSALDDLVQPFMRMLDDLTPYYQARMQWLSPQQRKIVEFLVNHSGAATVKMIAQRCFITQQTASGQLGKLAGIGYVHSERIGRESYYRLKEPLMRFSLDMKRQHGSPLPLIVDILRAWYFPDELETMLSALAADSMHRDYVVAAVEKNNSGAEDPRASACIDDYTAAVKNTDYTNALKAAEELEAISGSEVGFLPIAMCVLKLNRADTGYPAAKRRLDLDIELTTEEQLALSALASGLALKEKYLEAKILLERVKLSTGLGFELALFSSAVCSAHFGPSQAVMESFERCLKSFSSKASRIAVMRGVIATAFMSRPNEFAVEFEMLLNRVKQLGLEQEAALAFFEIMAAVISGGGSNTNIFQSALKSLEKHALDSGIGSVNEALAAAFVAITNDDDSILTDLSDEQLLLVRPLLDMRKTKITSETEASITPAV